MVDGFKVINLWIYGPSLKHRAPLNPVKNVTVSMIAKQPILDLALGIFAQSRFEAKRAELSLFTQAQSGTKSS